jgi:putative copper resistance protein D
VSGLNDPPDLLAAVLHWVEDIGLLGAIGSLVIRRLGRRQPRIDWARPRIEFALAAAFVGGLGLVFLDRQLSWQEVIRVVAEGLALVICLRGQPYVAPFAVFAAAVLPLTGHAARIEPAAGAEFADALHVLSAGMWAGGILALASLHPPGGWRGPEARVLLGRFSQVALIAFGVTALTGVLRATEQLNSISDLWTTPYGTVLALKVGGVGVMLVLSALALRKRPVLRAEAVVMAVVVGLTALLASFPLQA